MLSLEVDQESEVDMVADEHITPVSKVAKITDEHLALAHRVVWDITKTGTTVDRDRLCIRNLHKPFMFGLQ